MDAVNCKISNFVRSYSLSKRLLINCSNIDTTDLVNTSIARTQKDNPSTLSCSQLSCQGVSDSCNTQDMKVCTFNYTSLTMQVLSEGDGEFLSFLVDDFVSGVDPYTFEWIVEEADLEITSGQNTPTLAVTRVNWSNITTTVSCKITDSRGCYYTKSVNFNLANLCPGTLVHPFMSIFPAPVFNTFDGTNDEGVDRSIIKAQIDPDLLDPNVIGGQPPYTISNWTYNGQGLTPIGLVNNRNYNYFQRNIYDNCNCIDSCTGGCISITCKVTDAHGCTVTSGNTIQTQNLECVTNQGDFTITAVGSTGFTVNILNFVPGTQYDISVDNGVNYIVNNAVVANIAVTGLTASTNYVVVVRVDCTGSTDDSLIGPYNVQTTA